MFVFLKSKTHQLNLKDVIELIRNLRIKLLPASMNECKTMQLLLYGTGSKNLSFIRAVGLIEVLYKLSINSNDNRNS